MRYRPVFSDSAVVFFASISGRRQKNLLNRTQELANNPFLVSDFHRADEEGREIQHMLVGGFLFSYWPDHAARVVMIVEIEDAE